MQSLEENPLRTALKEVTESLPSPIERHDRYTVEQRFDDRAVLEGVSSKGLDKTIEVVRVDDRWVTAKLAEDFEKILPELRDLLKRRAQRKKDDPRAVGKSPTQIEALIPIFVGFIRSQTASANSVTEVDGSR